MNIWCDGLWICCRGVYSCDRWCTNLLKTGCEVLCVYRRCGTLLRAPRIMLVSLNFYDSLWIDSLECTLYCHTNLVEVYKEWIILLRSVEHNTRGSSHIIVQLKLIDFVIYPDKTLCTAKPEQTFNLNCMISVVRVVLTVFLDKSSLKWTYDTMDRKTEVQHWQSERLKRLQTAEFPLLESLSLTRKR